MTINKSLYSSDNQSWETPQYLFDYLDNIYHFTLDACANETNHKCDKYFTKEQDGLKQSWKGERVFVNPPYNKYQKDWIKKAFEEAEKDHNTVVVMLLPSRTDTKIFSEYVFQFARRIFFIKGRLKFVGAKTSAPFPSMIVVFNNKNITLMDIHNRFSILDLNKIKGKK